MNAFFCKFVPHAFTHPDHCIFCGAIESLEWERYQSSNGSRVNDVSSTLNTHNWQCGINAVYYTPEIDINDRLPVLKRGVNGRHCSPDPCVIK
ncbi:hypothetical protein MSHOH_3725 [Methanosarcina horonobensis HB-1 = JCM 15518]|uniref:Uncharacterized protein n=1 Tax=Methanosarcina horonobensis HB-1 = JCM 15518 TaxID=1434110 RepID=A0A0E3SJ67_9EURY|nr:hypothetical protein MSHOH_3725 [Methanosarcina horonobensis HB-1 = JCM 15518]